MAKGSVNFNQDTNRIRRGSFPDKALYERRLDVV